MHFNRYYVLLHFKIITFKSIRQQEFQASDGRKYKLEILISWGKKKKIIERNISKIVETNQ